MLEKVRLGELSAAAGGRDRIQVAPRRGAGGGGTFCSGCTRRSGAGPGRGDDRLSQQGGRGGITAVKAGAIATVLVSSLLVSVAPNFSKLAYQSGASVPLVMAGRFLVTVLLLGVVLLWQRRTFFTSGRVLRLCLLGGFSNAC